MANKKEAFLSKVRSTEIAVELLDMNERTIGRVEGTLINGGISVDGDSAVRRVANLTFLTTDDNYKVLETSNELSLNKKIKIFVGVRDLTTMNSEVSWYNQGIYIMTNSTSSASVDSQQISITAQDKMCLHNGEVAGELQYTTRIDSEVVSPEFQTELDAIQLLYSTLAEDFANRIAHLNNINARIITVYNQVVGDNSIIEAQCTSLISKIAILKITSKDKEYKKLLKDLKDDISNLKIESQNKKLTIREIIKYAVVSLGGETPGRVIINDIPDKVKTPIKLPSGENGFKMVKYIYPQDLTLSTGQPLTVIYDRCKEALGGNYEYFYDVEGNFVFQEVKNYRNTQAVPLEDLKSEDYALSYDRTPVQFDFTEDSLITSYNNAPNWGNIKNDFYVWGNNENEAIGYHLAIDDKPTVPKNAVDMTRPDKVLDWREYILHMNNIGRNRSFIGKYLTEPNVWRNEVPNPDTMSSFVTVGGAVVTNNPTYSFEEFQGNLNILSHSDFSKKQISTPFTVDGKTYNTYTEGYSSYNGGVPNPTVNFHAYSDYESSEGPFVVYNESNGSRNWKGSSQGINESLLSPGDYIFSADIKADGPGTKIFGGFYYTKIGATTQSFYSGQHSVSPGNITGWSRLSGAFKLNEDVDLSKSVSVYFYGYGFEGTSTLKMKNPKIEKSTAATPWSRNPRDFDGTDSSYRHITSSGGSNYTKYEYVIPNKTARYKQIEVKNLSQFALDISGEKIESGKKKKVIITGGEAGFRFSSLGNIDCVVSKVFMVTQNNLIPCQDDFPCFSLTNGVSVTKTSTYSPDELSGNLNIFKNSSFKETSTHWAGVQEIGSAPDGSTGAISTGAFGVTRAITQSVLGKIEPETDYVMSAEFFLEDIVKGTTNYTTMIYNDGYYLKDGVSTWYSFGSGSANTDVSGWQKLTTRFNLSKEIVENAVSMNCMTHARDFTGKVYVRNLKLEKGTVPTEWSPHVEDFVGNSPYKRIQIDFGYTEKYPSTTFYPSLTLYPIDSQEK